MAHCGEAGALADLADGPAHLTLERGRHRHVLDRAAGTAHEVMVVLRQGLGELVSRELAGHDPVHGARLLEHREVPVDRALGKAALRVRKLGDGDGIALAPQNVDDRSPLRRVALPDGAQPVLDGLVEVGHSSEPSARSLGAAPRLASATTTNSPAAISTIIPLDESPQIRAAPSPATTETTPTVTLQR